MPTWVIRKTLPAYDHGTSRTSTPTHLYWAGPSTYRLKTPSWVWISGLCPQVAFFPTCPAATAAAHAFAGPSWRTPHIQVVQLRHSRPISAAGFGDPDPSPACAGDTPAEDMSS